MRFKADICDSDATGGIVYDREKYTGGVMPELFNHLRGLKFIFALLAALFLSYSADRANSQTVNAGSDPAAGHL